MILCSLDIFSYLLFQKYSLYITNKVKTSIAAKLSINCTDNIIYNNELACRVLNNVRNFSSYNLSNTEKFALSFGLKFCVPFKKISPVPIKAKFESLYNQLSGLSPRSPISDALLRSRFVTLTNEIVKTCFSPALSPSSTSHLIALKNLTKNKDIVISRPDKGNGVVILDRVDYVEKMLHILGDKKRFKKDHKQEDCSNNIIDHVEKLLSNMVEKKFISENQAKTLVPTSATVPRLYGLPKVHKDNIPLRPLLSMIGSPQHGLAKFLAQVLKPIELFYAKFPILDSFDLVHKLQHVTYTTTNCRLGSLDVVSLFTCVPLRKCIDVIIKAVESGETDIKFDASSIGQLIEICVSNVQLLFNGIYYRQIDGVAMGSPLGPVLANVYVGYIECQLPHLCTDISFFGRYVDDVLVIAHNDRAIYDLRDRLNLIDNNIQFSVELEVNESLPFLDIRIHRDICGFRFSWYHKPSWTGSLLHYNSFVPLTWKIGLMKGFKSRILRICSPEYLTSAIHELTDVFSSNGYPLNLIHQNFIDYVPMPNNKKALTDSCNPIFVSLPFLGDSLSSAIAMRINRYVKAAFPTAKVIVQWRPMQAASFPLKDQIPTMAISNVVYHFRCPCETDDYIGRTKLPLAIRVKQHLPQWLLEGKHSRPRSDKPPDSAITRHRLICKVPSENLKSCFKIVHKARNQLMLKILEALEIKSRQPTLCTQKDRLYELKIPWL